MIPRKEGDGETGPFDTFIRLVSQFEVSKVLKNKMAALLIGDENDKTHNMH